jgi:hypothetical protein
MVVYDGLAVVRGSPNVALGVMGAVKVLGGVVVVKQRYRGLKVFLK